MIQYFFDYVKINNELWFAGRNYNGLYSIDLDTNKMKRLGTFPTESLTMTFLFARTFKYDNQVIFIPACAKAINIYDRKTQEFQLVDIPYKTIDSDRLIKFVDAVQYNDNLFLIGYHYPGIIKYSLKNSTLEIIDDFLDQLYIKNGKNISLFGTKAAIKENFIYIPCSSTNAIMKFDMNSNEYKIIHLGDSANQYIRIEYVKSLFFLVSRNNGTLLIWDEEHGGVRTLELQYRHKCMDKMICSSKSYLWVIPTLSGEIYKISLLDCSIKKIEIDNEAHIKFEYSEVRENCVIAINSYSGKCYQIDEQDNILELEIQYIGPERRKDYIEMCMNDLYKQELVKCCETEVMGLYYLIAEANYSKKEEGKQLDTAIGRMIFEEI